MNYATDPTHFFMVSLVGKRRIRRCEHIGAHCFACFALILKNPCEDCPSSTFAHLQVQRHRPLWELTSTLYLWRVIPTLHVTKCLNPQRHENIFLSPTLPHNLLTPRRCCQYSSTHQTSKSARDECTCHHWSWQYVWDCTLCKRCTQRRH